MWPTRNNLQGRCASRTGRRYRSLVDPNDPVAMAEALYQMWTDEGLRQTMARQALAHSKQFGWYKCATQTLDILKKLGEAA